MATVDWTCNKDARVADNGTSLGAGASDWNAIGTYGGYQYRTLLGFSYSFSGMVSISSAILHIRTSTQYYVAFGSDPDIAVKRLSSSWSEGTAVSLSGSNSVEWDNQPGVTGTLHTADISTSESTWDTVDITNTIQEALAAGVFYGLRLYAYNGSAESSSSTDVTEIYSREQGSSDPYITVTYSTNVVPSAPTLTSPANAAIVTTNPTFALTHVDSDGDALLQYHIQVDNNSDFSSPILNTISAGGITGNNVSYSYSSLGGAALTRGTTYYWRVATESATGTGGEGAWSTSRTFVVNSLPVTTLTEPAATGRTARVTYSPGAGWTSPRLYVSWSSTDADGTHSQVKYQVFIKNNADGSTHYDSGTVTSTATSLTVPTTLTEGNYYRIKVLTWDALEAGSYSTELTVRARWGVGLYRYDMTAAPTSVSLTTLSTTTGSSSEVAIEYSTNTTTTTPGTFYSTVGGVPLQRYFFYRVYLYAWGSATPTSPSLDSLVISYSAVVLIADKWTRSDATTGVIISDPGSYVYGSQALRIAANGSKYAYQSVTVLPNTDYILSGRIKSLGNSGATLDVANDTNTVVLYTMSAVSATQDFTAITPISFNSGAATTLIIRCRATGSTGTYAWFDALKLEASSVATPWTPGFIGDAVGIDAGGVQIDASAGGLFRLRGSVGGTRDTVSLGTNGLLFGGDVGLASESAGNLTVAPASGGSVLMLRGVAATPSMQLYRNGEAAIRAQLTDSGLSFGPGTAAVDTNLYRSAADVLKTDDSMNVAGSYLAFTGVQRSGGSAFPGGPSSGDQFFRTDMGMEFYYDGTRWLSTQVFTGQMQGHATGVGQAATASNMGWVNMPLYGGSDLWLVDAHAGYLVLSGGTALGASHKWDLDFQKGQNGTGTFTSVGAIAISSGASSAVRENTVVIGALMNNGTAHYVIRCSWTKTGTPGALLANTSVRYRVVKT